MQLEGFDVSSRLVCTEHTARSAWQVVQYATRNCTGPFVPGLGSATANVNRTLVNGEYCYAVSADSHVVSCALRYSTAPLPAEQCSRSVPALAHVSVAAQVASVKVDCSWCARSLPICSDHGTYPPRPCFTRTLLRLAFSRARWLVCDFCCRHVQQRDGRMRVRVPLVERQLRRGVLGTRSLRARCLGLRVVSAFSAVQPSFHGPCFCALQHALSLLVMLTVPFRVIRAQR
jgi:hypothetical protein